MRRRHCLERIFDNEFRQWGETTVAVILEAIELRKSVPDSWRKDWLANPSWPPWNYPVQGLHHRIFTADEERSIKEFIISNHLIPGLFFCDQMFGDIAIQAFLTQYADLEKVPQFNRSARFINNFKERNRLSSRSVHSRRRPTVEPIQEQEWITFMKDLVSPSPNGKES
jgi:hypothetical protein